MKPILFNTDMARANKVESRAVHFSELSKTVFLTREEAEAALAKMRGDGNG